MMCTTTTHWATHYSTACSIGGSGQCDGECYDHHIECSCPCHRVADLPETVEAVRDWHDDFHDVVSSHDTEEQAITEANRRNQKPVDGTLYVPMAGAEADRYVVAHWS
jgi:hypothetical protein